MFHGSRLNNHSIVNLSIIYSFGLVVKPFSDYLNAKFIKKVTTFQQIALLLIVLWLGMVTMRFRHSNFVLTGGLFAIGVFTLASFAISRVTLSELGLGVSLSWLSTIGFALAGLVVLLAYSPIADWLATQWFAKPAVLEAFGVIHQSRLKLIAGIAAAWLQ